MEKSELIKRVEEYIAWDPVESTRNEIQKLFENNKWDELEKRIMHRLTFGTAGWLLSSM